MDEKKQQDEMLRDITDLLIDYNLPIFNTETDYENRGVSFKVFITVQPDQGGE